MKNPLQRLEEHGQAVWLDDIHRELLSDGTLDRLIEEDGLKGLTTNPAIFRKAIAKGSAYDEQIEQLKNQRMSPEEILTALMVEDVRAAADILRPLYDASNGEHGYVSLEVNPHFARHSGPTIEEARKLWVAVARPNIFIKVPATREGLTAIETLLGEGINVNVTLLFGLRRYGEVATAFMAGMERRLRKQEPVARLRSVASFFLSRIDVILDPELKRLAAEGGERGRVAQSVRGLVGLASAKVAYQMSKEIFGGDRWRRLAAKGSRSQRLLWASTSAKLPGDSATKYVEPLIGANTVNTMPMKTLEAYRAQGKPQATLEEGLDHARRALQQLGEIGVDLHEVSGQLEEEGIEKFCEPYDETLRLLQEETAEVQAR